MRTFLDNISCSGFLLMVVFITSCGRSSKPQMIESNTTESEAAFQSGAPIGEYVVEIFEDKKGNLWFGTMAKGVARYDGKSLSYITVKDGLFNNTVVSIAEDAEGNMWFGTHGGLVKYDGQKIKNFTRTEGLYDDRISNILIDSAGNIWVGTWSGVYRYDGAMFSKFPIPKPEVELHSYQTTMNWNTEIVEDQQGNIWFARDGYGVCKYDGTSFFHFTKKDGLLSNCVHAIQEDRQGNIWIGSRVTERDHPEAKERKGAGGLNRYDGEQLISYPALEGLNENDIYAIYEDRAGDIWIGANRFGLYRYDGTSFQLYPKTDRIDLTYSFSVQSILEDRQGNLWLGFSGGLFRLQDSSLVHVTQDGPWK